MTEHRPKKRTEPVKAFWATFAGLWIMAFVVVTGIVVWALVRYVSTFTG